MKRLGQEDLLRQMLGVERAEAVQLLEHRCRDSLRLDVLWPAMHDAVPHGGQRVVPRMLFDPVHERAHGHGVVGPRHRARTRADVLQALCAERGFRCPDPVNRSLQDARERSDWPRTERT